VSKNFGKISKFLGLMLPIFKICPKDFEKTFRNLGLMPPILKCAQKILKTF
jgi:hypothetical protein